MSKLTADEEKWLKGVQKALNKKGSGRLGFFATGDSFITAYNKEFDDEIDDIQDAGTSDMCSAVVGCDAGFDFLLEFPSSVHSTAG
jgi:nucleoside phosphorylase